MREQILTFLEKNSKIDLQELAIMLGSSEEVIANEVQKKEYITKIRRMSEPSIKLDDTKIDRIYTFVTCSYERDDNRTYVHAVEE